MRESPQSYLIRFARNSCYVFTLGRAAEKLLNKQIAADYIFAVATHSKNVGEDGYVRDAESFLEEVSLHQLRVYKTKVPGTETKKRVVIEHWREPHGNEHFKMLDWDPLAVKCTAVTGGEIVDYRIVERP